MALGGGAIQVTKAAGGEADIEPPGLWTLRFLLSITLGWPVAWLEALRGLDVRGSVPCLLCFLT